MRAADAPPRTPPIRRPPRLTRSDARPTSRDQLRCPARSSVQTRFSPLPREVVSAGIRPPVSDPQTSDIARVGKARKALDLLRVHGGALRENPTKSSKCA